MFVSGVLKINPNYRSTNDNKYSWHQKSTHQPNIVGPKTVVFFGGLVAIHYGFDIRIGL